jgi:hypothetical protein
MSVKLKVEFLPCYDKAELLAGLGTVKDCGELIPTASISLVDVGWGITMKSGTREWHGGAINSYGDMLQPGPAARKFFNGYARLYSRYSGIDGVKLGKESMTGGEKFMMAVSIATAAAGGFAAMSNMGTALSRTSIIMGSSMAAMATLQVIQNSRNEMRALLRADSWKAIPVSPTPLAFKLDGI